MTTTVPQLPQVPQKTQPPQGAPSSVNNPAFNSQQVAQSAVHPAQFAQPVYVLPEQENTHTQGWVLAIASRHRGHMRVAGVALGVMNMLLGILTVPFEMLLLILVMMHV